MDDKTSPDELLTVDELAAQLKVPVRTIRQWSVVGTGPKRMKVGRYVRYRRSDVSAWLQSQYVA